VIQGRRESGSTEPDVLQTFIDARYKDGSRLTNDQVLGMLIAVLFAGQHTSSITSTWTGLLIHRQQGPHLPQPGEGATERVMEKHGDKIDFDVLAEMDELHFCIKEALRMHPPLIMLLRQCHVPFEVETTEGKKFVVPKGHIVATSPRSRTAWTSVYTEPRRSTNPNGSRVTSPRTRTRSRPSSGSAAGGTDAWERRSRTCRSRPSGRTCSATLTLSSSASLPEPDYEGMVVGPKHPCTVRYKRRKL
jgi:sterol 14-demethylase